MRRSNPMTLAQLLQIQGVWCPRCGRRVMGWWDKLMHWLTCRREQER